MGGRGDGRAPSARALPFYCPYCGEEDFRPTDEANEFHCRDCDRRFSLCFLGLGAGSTEEG